MFGLSAKQIEELIAAKKIGSSPGAKRRADDAYCKGDDVGVNGNVSYLNTMERMQLEKWILNHSFAGQSVSYKEVLLQAQSVKKGRICGYDYLDVEQPKSGRHWVKRFVRSHPSLDIKKAKILEVARQRAWNRENIAPFYKRFIYSLFYFFFIILVMFISLDTDGAGHT